VGPRPALHRIELLLVPPGSCRELAEYYSDLDVIVDDELWKPGTFDDMRGLYAWGPDVPAEFLLAHDVAELVAGR